jgi:hypothetical protein
LSRRLKSTAELMLISWWNGLFVYAQEPIWRSHWCKGLIRRTPLRNLVEFSPQSHMSCCTQWWKGMPTYHILKENWV